MEPQPEAPIDPAEAPAGEGEQAEGESEGEEEKSLTPYERKMMEVKYYLKERESQACPKKFVTKTTFQQGSEDERKEIFSCEFDHEDKFICAGLSDGSI